MPRQKSEKRACVYVADTECTTTVDYEQDGHVYAYALCMSSVRTAEITAGNATTLPEHMEFSGPGTMEEFTDGFIERIPKEADLSFYNTRYDCQFIIDYLMRHRGYVSYTWDERQARKAEAERARADYVRNNPECRSRVVIDEVTGTVAVKSRGVPRAVTAEWEKKRVIVPIRSGSRLIELDIYNSKGHKLRITDVGSKFTNLPQWDDREARPITGVEAIARMFGLEKSPLDVSKYRGDGYVPGEEEMTRCRTDVVPIRMAMEKMYSLGLIQSTLAGDAWKIFSAIRDVGIRSDDRTGRKRKLLAGLGIDVEPCSLPDDGILSDMAEQWVFDDGTVVDIRRAYRGGVTYVNPKYQDRKLKTRKGRRMAHDDCNSMHPKSMTCMMPYGLPRRTRNSPDGDFYIMQCMCRFSVKKGRWPVISNSASGMDSAEWLYEGMQTLCLTSWDWKWVEANYDVEYIGDRYYLSWDTRVNESARIYVDHFTKEKARWKKVKKNGATESERMEGEVMYYVSKILMNALYGKFGQDPVKPYEWCRLDGDIVSYGKSNVEAGQFDDSRYHKYLPFACSVTGCSRDRLWQHIDDIGYGNYIYGDTDSEFFWTPCETDEELAVWMNEKGVDVDSVRLGAWDVEDGLDVKITEAKFVRAKVYGFVKEDGDMVIKTAGLPIEARKRMTGLDEMYIGAVFEGAKKVPKNVPGGQILDARDFTLKEH